MNDFAKQTIRPVQSNWATYNIPGVRFSLSLGGNPIEMYEYRALGNNFLPGQRARISAHIAAGRLIHGFEIGYGGDIVLKSMDTAADGGQDVGRNVMIFSGGEQAWSYTRHTQNHFMLLELEMSGEVTIYEVALVSQEGEFFLAVAPYRSARCCRDGRAIKVLKFEEKWWQLADAIRTLASGVIKIENLHPVPIGHESVQDVYDKEFPDGVGRVIWWSCASGTGSIATRHGTARAYWRRVRPRDGFAYLVPGEVVVFDHVAPPEPGFRETQFKLEAFGIVAF